MIGFNRFSRTILSQKTLNIFKNNQFYLKRNFTSTILNNSNEQQTQPQHQPQHLKNKKEDGFGKLVTSFLNQNNMKNKEYFNLVFLLSKKNKWAEIKGHYLKNLSFNKFDPKFYTTTMKLLKDGRRYDEAIEVYKDYETNITSGTGDQDNKYIITTLMACYAGLGDMEKAVQLFNEMPSEQDSTSIPFTIIINGFLDKAQIDKALEWLERLGNTPGRTTDTTSMNYLLSKLAKIGQFQFCDSIIKQMTKNNLQLDAFSYTGLLNGLINNFENKGNASRLSNTINEVIANENYLKIDQKLMVSLMQGLTLLKKYNQVLELYRKYKDQRNIDMMERDILFPLITSYRSLDTQIHYPELMSIWEKSKQTSITSRITIHYLKTMDYIAHSHRVQGKEEPFDLTELIKSEISYAVEKRKLDFSTNIEIHNMLIRSYLNKDMVPEAWNIFQLTVREQIADTRTFSSMIKYLCRHASQSTVIYNNVVEILTSSYYVNLLENQSFQTKYDIWVPLLSKFIQQNQHQDILTVLNIMYSYTSEDIKDYYYILKPYFSQNHPNINLNQLFK